MIDSCLSGFHQRPGARAQLVCSIMSHQAYYYGDSHPSYFSSFTQCHICLSSVNEGSAEGLSLRGYCEVEEVLLGLEIVLQEFANSDFQKCFRQLYKCQQMCMTVEEPYF
jgi:hypothetical protein